MRFILNTCLRLFFAFAISMKIINGSPFLPDTAAVSLPGST